MVTYKIIDTPTEVTHFVNLLRSNGIETVIRYLALGHTWKTVNAAEARAIAEGGLKLGLVFEVDGKPHGSNEGSRDGHAAYMGAKEVGAPQNAILWYAVDYDPSPSDMVGIIQVFVAFRREVSPYYRVGAYCSGYCARKLIEAGVIDTTLDSTTNKKLPCIWITQSLGFKGSRDYLDSGEPFVLFQLMPTHMGSLDVDPNAVWHNYLHEVVDIGDFVPFATTEVA
jgi:hypothetical protein